MKVKEERMFRTFKWLKTSSKESPRDEKVCRSCLGLVHTSKHKNESGKSEREFWVVREELNRRLKWKECRGGLKSIRAGGRSRVRKYRRRRGPK